MNLLRRLRLWWSLLRQPAQPLTGEWLDPEPRQNYNVKPEGGCET